MNRSASDYDVVIAGAGLAGLTTAYYLKKTRPELNVVVLERSGTAGGLTGNWIDHCFGPDKKLQMPMHMIFREKYANLVRLVEEIGGSFSPLYTGFSIITGDGTRHRLEMDDWTARNLPPPFHALGMFAKLKMPIREKWDLFKLGCVSTYCAKALLGGQQEPRLVPNTMSLESLELALNMGPRARDFFEAVTPSIYNTHPWYTSAPRIAAVMAGTMTLTRDALHYHVFGKNYNAAFIDRYVERLKAMGVEFRFWTEVRRIDSNADGTCVDSVWCRPYGPEAGGDRYVCDNCGAENYRFDRAFCTRCGRDTTLDRIREGKIRKPTGRELWMEVEQDGCERLRCRWLVTAMYPHMIARLIPLDSPLRKHPYVRSFYSSRGNQTQLSIGRVYYRKNVTRGEKEITGTHNPYFSFNGCQSVLNNFGPEDLGWTGGDVIDVLLDVGLIRDAHTQKTQIRRIVEDLHRVYPDADPSLVEHVSFADIYPDVLYLTEQPAIAGLHRFFNTHRTGAANWFVAGCHSGLIGIGMESAVESAMSTVNLLLEAMKVSDRIPIRPYEVHAGSRLAAAVGKTILLWKGRGRSFGRLAGSTYAMPEKDD
jgi:Thi4 family protein/flavin-dependent amine oxidoreductase